MFDFDPKEYAGANLRTVPERVLHCRLQAIGQILSLIISGVLIILTIIALGYFSHFAIINLLIATVASLLLSIFLIYWGFSSARLLRESTDLYQGNVRPFLTLSALLGALIFAGIYEVYIYLGYFFKRWFISKQEADSSVSNSVGRSLENWQSYFESFFIWFLILSFVQFLLFVYSAFAAYQCIPGESTLRRVFAVSNLLLCALGSIVIYLAVVCRDYLALGNLVNLPSATDIDLMWWLALICIVISIVGVVVNLRRSKVLYFIIAGALFVAALFSLTQSPSILRAERQSYANTFPNCNQNMQYINRDFIQSDLKCPAKYLPSGSNCSKSQVAHVWEDDLSKDPNTKAYSTACLNNKCCGVITNALLNPFAQLGSWGLFLTVAIAVTGGVAFLIAGRQGVISPNANRLIELVSAGLQALVLLLLVILILTRSSNKVNTNPTLGLANAAANQGTVSRSLPSAPHNVPCAAAVGSVGSQTSNFDQFIDTFPIDASKLSGSNSVAGVRVLVYQSQTTDSTKFNTAGSYAYLPPGYSSDSVRVLNPYGFATVAGSDLLLVVEGKKEDLKKFFREDVKFCVPTAFLETVSTSVSSSITLNPVFAQVDLTNSLAAVVPNQTTAGNQTVRIDFAAVSLPWATTKYKVHGVLAKTVYDNTGNAQVKPIDVQATGKNTKCSYSLKAIPVNPNEKLDIKCTVPKGSKITTTDWISLTIQNSTLAGGFTIDKVKLLEGYLPYTLRIFFTCVEFTGKADAADLSTISVTNTYEAYVDANIGGYPRVDQQDLGVILLRTNGFPNNELAALAQRRVLTHVRSPRKAVRAPAAATNNAPGKEAVYVVHPGRALVRIVDAANNTGIQGATGTVLPQKKYAKQPDPTPATPKSQVNGWVLYQGTFFGVCYSESLTVDNGQNRDRVHASSNGTGNAVIQPGFVDVNGFSSLSRDYHVYRSTNRFLYTSKQSSYIPVTIPLVPRATDQDNIRIALEWGSQVLDLELYVVFNIPGGNKLSCLVGPAYKTCAGATFHADNNNGSEYGGELLSLNIRPYVYLVYVKAYLGKTSDPSNARTLLGEPYFSNANKYVTDSFARVSVYTHNRDERAFEFHMPGINNNTYSDNLPKDANKNPDRQRLVWNAFCLDGSVGIRSLTPLGQFWTPQDASVQAPSPATCETYYTQTKGNIPYA